MDDLRKLEEETANELAKAIKSQDKKGTKLDKNWNYNPSGKKNGFVDLFIFNVHRTYICKCLLRLACNELLSRNQDKVNYTHGYALNWNALRQMNL